MSSEGTKGHRSLLQIEEHSIDYIPESERHGKPWQQLPFWFGNGCSLTSAGIGFIGPSLGLNLTWSVTATVTGMAFGTVFMALHANQGPRLGLPQMIQSRAQFGSRGVVLPLVLAVFIYVSFIVATALFTRSAFNHLFNTNVGHLVLSDLHRGGHGHRDLRLRLGPRCSTGWAGYFGLAFFIVVNVLLWMYTSERGVHEVAAKFSGFCLDAVPGPVRGRGRLPDRVRHLHRGLHPVPAVEDLGAEGDRLRLQRRHARPGLVRRAGRRGRVLLRRRRTRSAASRTSAITNCPGSGPR